MREVRACREAFPEAYVKVIAYDAEPTAAQTSALSFIVNRPSVEHGFELERIEDRRPHVIRYRLQVHKRDGRRHGRSATQAMRGADPATNGS